LEKKGGFGESPVNPGGNKFFCSPEKNPFPKKKKAFRKKGKAE